MILDLSPPEDRLMEKVSKRPGRNSCWIFTGAKIGKGYGYIWHGPDDGMILAHRLSYLLWKGRIPDGLCVLHKCDTPACVNPDHLFLGTKGDNIRDCWRKGRGKVGRRDFGEDNGNSRLTESDVRKILALKGQKEQRDVAKMFGVAHSTIGRIQRGEIWKQVYLERISHAQS